MTSPYTSLETRWLADLRPGQKILAQWRRGPLAIAAVPGAGKSHALAITAALTVLREKLDGQRQLLVVTYTRAAAWAIRQKIGDRLREAQHPVMGFTVQTLHSLAWQIALSQPLVSGVDGEKPLLEVQAHHPLVRQAVMRWAQEDGDRLDRWCGQGTKGVDGWELARRRSVLTLEVLPQLLLTLAREMKQSGLGGEMLRRWLADLPEDRRTILTLALELHDIYTREVQHHGYIDHGEMMLGALRVLATPEGRSQWQRRFFGVFEDEAQDSSGIQQQLITLLAQDGDDPEAPPNLVRVGDDNQGINATFTAADPLYFRDFCDRSPRVAMTEAGRSAIPIIRAVNQVQQWVNRQGWQGDFPFSDRSIVPVSLADRQGNPEAVEGGVHLTFPTDPPATVAQLAQSIQTLYAQDPLGSFAILVRENRQGRYLMKELSERLAVCRGLRLEEADSRYRQNRIPQEMLELLRFIHRPHSPLHVRSVLGILQKRGQIAAQDIDRLAMQPENFLYPSPLVTLPPEADQARQVCQTLLQSRWQLPGDQWISCFAQMLAYEGQELASAHKLEEQLRQEGKGKGQVGDRIEQLAQWIAASRFQEVPEEDNNAYCRPGQVTIITMHKAKGLDWDYVFLPFVHHDQIPGEVWSPKSAGFLGNYTLDEVARTQLRWLIHRHYLGLPLTPGLTPGEAWLQFAQFKKGEEYRLFYVALSRAKKLLWLAACQLGPFRWSQVQGELDPLSFQQKIPAQVLEAIAFALDRQPFS